MEVKNIICERCGHQMVVGATEEMGDGIETRLFCPHCGIVIELYDSEEFSLSDYEIYDVPLECNMNNHYCIRCGNKLKIDSNGCLSDRIDTIDACCDDDKMSLIFHPCSNCGICDERWDTSENEKCIFPYWNQNTSDYDTAINCMKHYSESMRINVLPEHLKVIAELEM